MRRLDGDLISKMRAGAPEQPRSVNLFGSQIRGISRLNPIFIIRIRVDGERRRINAAFSAVGLDIISKKSGNLVGNFLMNPAERVPYYEIARRSALHAARRAISSNL